MKATILIYIITLSLSIFFGIGMANSVDAQCIGIVYYEIIIFVPYFITLIAIGASTNYIKWPMETILINFLIMCLSLGVSMVIMNYKDAKANEKYKLEENVRGEIFAKLRKNEMDSLLLQIPISQNKDSLYFKLGNLEKGNWDKALFYFDTVIKINPNFYSAYWEASRAAEVNSPRNYKKALEYLEKMCKINPNDEECQRIGYLKEQIRKANMPADQIVDMAIEEAGWSEIEAQGLYSTLISNIPDDKDERTILGEKLKAKGFVVTNWGRGNFHPHGPRIINITFTKENCQCEVSKMYYSTEVDTLYSVMESIRCLNLK